MYQTQPPAQYWQSQLVEWGPKVLFAVLILVVTHFVAKAVQWAISKLVDRLPVLKRHPGVVGLAVGVGRSVASLFPAFLIYWIILIPYLNLTSAIALRNLAQPREEFGGVRLWGTIGWMASGWVVCGWLVALGSSTLTACFITGMVMMKIISSTSITSTRGVMLISFITSSDSIWVPKDMLSPN